MLQPGKSYDDVRTRFRWNIPARGRFVDSLPMTATGKIVRRELRARERAAV